MRPSVNTPSTSQERSRTRRARTRRSVACISLLDDPGAEQIVQVQCTDQPLFGVDDQELRHLGRGFHQLDAIDGEALGADGARLATHQASDALSTKVADAGEAAAQIAVGEDACDTVI